MDRNYYRFLLRAPARKRNFAKCIAAIAGRSLLPRRLKKSERCYSRSDRKTNRDRSIRNKSRSPYSAAPVQRKCARGVGGRRRRRKKSENKLFSNFAPRWASADKPQSAIGFNGRVIVADFFRARAAPFHHRRSHPRHRNTFSSPRLASGMVLFRGLRVATKRSDGLVDGQWRRSTITNGVCRSSNAGGVVVKVQKVTE